MTLPSVSYRVGRIVRRRRMDAGISQLRLSIDTWGNGNAARMSKIEDGHACTLENLNAVASALGCQLRDLMPSNDNEEK